MALVSKFWAAGALTSNLLLAWCTEMGESPGAATCTDAGIDATPQPPLRWRALPYGSRGSGNVYGGQAAVQAFAQNGFGGPVHDDDWDLLFTHHSTQKGLEEAGFARRQPRYRLVNHCAYFKGAGQKCKLAGHLKRAEAAVQRGHEGVSSPAAPRKVRHLQAFVLGRADARLQWHRTVETEPQRYWILKPCAAGHSKGIRIVNGTSARSDKAWKGEWTVAQEYLASPYLFSGRHKFHMRLYVLVPRWDPVTVLLYNEGLVFRSRDAYDGSAPDLRRDVFSGVSGRVEPLKLAALWAELGEANATLVRDRVLAVLSETMGEAVEESFGSASVLHERGYDCFDLFGADVMLDQELYPLLLEINMGPNLWLDRTGDEDDKAVKEPLVHQLAAWAAQRLRLGRESSAEEHRELEARTLPDFSRVL